LSAIGSLRAAFHHGPEPERSTHRGRRYDCRRTFRAETVAKENQLVEVVQIRLLDGASRGSLVSVSRVGEKLLEDALKLGLPERAELAAELLASLDGAPDEDAEAAWAAEIERRAARARSGDDSGRPWPEVRDRIRNGLSKR
jgi:putative addiction module component (TIGR02574 family)